MIIFIFVMHCGEPAIELLAGDRKTQARNKFTLKGFGMDFVEKLNNKVKG